MSYREFIMLAAGVILALGLGARICFAQVPQHYPGTICFTPQFWCYAQPPGPPGTACVCLTPYGPVGGYRN